MYGRITSLENLKKHFSSGGSNPPPYNTPVGEEYYISQNRTSPPERKANAAIVILGISFFSTLRNSTPDLHLMCLRVVPPSLPRWMMPIFTQPETPISKVL